MKDFISRDEMIEQTKARIVLGAPKFNTGLEAAIEVATSIPAADVVEVRHAHWYLDNGCAFCSECKNSFPPKIRSQALFCPRCGAKMDGGKNK